MGDYSGVYINRFLYLYYRDPLPHSPSSTSKLTSMGEWIPKRVPDSALSEFQIL